MSALLPDGRTPDHAVSEAHRSQLAELEARLREANATTGSLVFELLMGGTSAPIRGGKRRKA